MGQGIHFSSQAWMVGLVIALIDLISSPPAASDNSDYISLLIFFHMFTQKTLCQFTIKQGAGKQKGTTSEAVRSPKPHVQPIAKNKVQKEIVEPSKVLPPIERNKAEKSRSPKPHEDIPAQKMQGSKKLTETAMSLEVVGSQIIHENFAGEKKQGPEKGKIPSLIEFSKMLLEVDRAAKLPKQQAKKTKGKGSLVKPTKKVQVPKEVKKPKGKDTSAPQNLSKASEQPLKRKLPLQAATLGSPSKRAKVRSSGPLKSADSLLSSQPGEEESGEEEEKSICQEGEEEEDEGGDEEGGDDEKEGGEKAKEEGRESDEENEDGSDGEKTDEGEGNTGNDEDSKDDGKGDSGDEGKGEEEGDLAENMDGSDEGDGDGASTDGSGSDERDGVGWTVEDEESTPKPWWHTWDSCCSCINEGAF
ncbi:hypothetical protein L7F22_005577 [Adiantum nelumboides]|nr:hypothetical protein [Adiantum nelumboides]